MYWLFTDETNLEPSQGRFFIYGGLIFEPQQVIQAHQVVESIRDKYGFERSDEFKFHTRSRPPQVSIDNFKTAKAEAISSLEQVGAVIIIYVVLHDIARNQERQTCLEWALNSVVAHFDMRFLAEKSDFGAVCLDRVPESFGYSYLVDKFQNGVTLPTGRTPRLWRILHYSMSCDGASHLSSLVDIALGGVRYCINAAGGAGNEPVARGILPPLARMMWGIPKPEGGRQVGGYGFLQYPKDVQTPTYRAEY